MNQQLSTRRKLEILSQNLQWTWNAETTGVFRDLDPDLWTNTNHNPLAFLASIDDPALEARVRSRALTVRINTAYRRLHRYLEDQDTWGGHHAGLLRVHPVAYFSAEFGIHESLPLYSGGLGVLAGDHMKSASDLGLPVVGIGIFYRKGYFHQSLDKSGWQAERYETANTDLLPMEPARDESGAPIVISFRSGRERVHAAVWKMAIGRCSLYLLDTDLEENSAEYREVTHRLYWGGQKERIRQEIVLGIGGMRALEALKIRPGAFHLNEGHSAFALLEAIRRLMNDNGVEFDEALQEVSSRTLFTTHTPVPAGHDRFPAELVQEHLPAIREQLGITWERLIGLGRIDPQDEEETFCMTVLALRLAQRTNGVSAIHGEVSRRMWQDLWPHRAVQDVPIGHITNGIHSPSWLSPTIHTHFERQAGPRWMRALSKPEAWEELEHIDDEAIWETHQVQKNQLVDFVRRRFVMQELARGTEKEVIEDRLPGLLDPHALTLGFARRFATYKRATLLLKHRERLEKLLADEARPVQIIIAGKAHPRDDSGKLLIQEWARLQNEAPFKGRVIFVEDYDINVGRQLVQGVDVWVNNPRKPEEACGTSGMKVAVNGGLNLSILDGWWAEAYDGLNGFAINPPGPHSDPDVQEGRDAEALIDTLENEVIPLFYARDEDGIPTGWVARMRRSISSLLWRYSADRMVIDYATRAYLPAAGGLTAHLPQGLTH